MGPGQTTKIVYHNRGDLETYFKLVFKRFANSFAAAYYRHMKKSFKLVTLIILAVVLTQALTLVGVSEFGAFVIGLIAALAILYVYYIKPNADALKRIRSTFPQQYMPFRTNAFTIGSRENADGPIGSLVFTDKAVAIIDGKTAQPTEYAYENIQTITQEAKMSYLINTMHLKDGSTAEFILNGLLTNEAPFTPEELEATKATGINKVAGAVSAENQVVNEAAQNMMIIHKRLYALLKAHNITITNTP